MSVSLNTVISNAQQLQHRASEALGEFVQSAKSFFGRAVEFCRSIPDRLKTHFESARRPVVVDVPRLR